MRTAYDDSTKALARHLRGTGLSYKEIAKNLNVPAHTIYRWCNPEYAHRNRESARRWKQNHKKSCVNCGRPVWHSSTLCISCANIPGPRPQLQKWTREILIDRIQEWARLYGAPPSATDWNSYQARVEHNNQTRAAVFDNDDHWPWFTSVVRRFGSWNAGIRAAGFEPNPPHGGAGRQWGRRQAIR